MLLRVWFSTFHDLLICFSFNHESSDLQIGDSSATYRRMPYHHLLQRHVPYAEPSSFCAFVPSHGFCAAFPSLPMIPLCSWRTLHQHPSCALPSRMPSETRPRGCSAAFFEFSEGLS